SARAELQIGEKRFPPARLARPLRRSAQQTEKQFLNVDLLRTQPGFQINRLKIQKGGGLEGAVNHDETPLNDGKTVDEKRPSVAGVIRACPRQSASERRREFVIGTQRQPDDGIDPLDLADFNFFMQERMPRQTDPQ